MTKSRGARLTSDWKPDPQMTGWEYRDFPSGREHRPIVTVTRFGEVAGISGPLATNDLSKLGRAT